MKLEHGTPMDIEGESMRIIREELSAMGITLPGPGGGGAPGHPHHGGL